MSSRPNILLVITDQQHHRAVGAVGNPWVCTPHLDRLAADGCRLDRFFVTQPLCAPSRASLFYGRFPSETGVHHNELWPRSDLPTLGTQLRQVGYRTAYVGKWHLYPTMTYAIPGFEVPVSGVNNIGLVSDGIVTRGCEGFLQSVSGSEPFLLAACYQQPHDICQWVEHHGPRIEEPARQIPEDQLPPLPDNFAARPEEPAGVQAFRRHCAGNRFHWSERAWRYYLWSYYRMVEEVDAQIGRLLMALDRSGHADDTLVIFCSDHGEGLGHHGLQLKQTLYDEHIRSPAIVRYPRSIPANSQRQQLASGLDLVPTCCDYAEAPCPPACRGHSLRGMLENDQSPNRPAVYAEAHRSAARMVRTDRYKYIQMQDDPVEQLFDCGRDPGETVNLARDPDHAAARRDHRRLLREWQAALEVPAGVPTFSPLDEDC